MSILFLPNDFELLTLWDPIVLVGERLQYTQPKCHTLQVVNFTGLLQLVNKLQQARQFHQVATSLLKSGLLQLVICRLVTTC